MYRLKKIIVPIIVIIILFVIYNYLRFSTRTIYNVENAQGNTAGNLFNGGLFCELNEKIYFSNANDDGALYVMNLEGKNFKKLHYDKVGYINAIGKYIYYVRMNNEKKNNSTSVLDFKNVGIYRTNLKGKNIITLYEDPSGLMNVHGNSVYYQHYNTNGGLSFYSVDIDGSNEKEISTQPIMPISIVDNKLCYVGTEIDHNINILNLKSGTNTTIYYENCYAPIINNEFIYYMSASDNYAIYRINLDGSNPTPVVEDRCSTFNITDDGKYLYYQVDDNVNNRICILNVETGESNTIKDGNFKQIHITSNYMFFNDFQDTATYYIPIGSDTNLSTFTPPNLSK